MFEIFDKLTKKLREYGNILIMSHKNTDLDGLSSSVVLCSIARKFKKKSNVYIREKNDLVRRIENKFDSDIIINNCDEYFPNETLLVVLDTNSTAYVEDEKLLSIYKHVIVIDHHFKDDNYLKDTELSYINSGLSSVIEFMTLYIKYLDFKISEDLSTLMLAGLEIDTNSFNTKTTPDTYKAAGILVENGASLELKRDILRESREDILKRYESLKKSYVYKEIVSICVLDDRSHTSVELAQIADELLSFKNIQISFCIGSTKTGETRVSIRTLGKYAAHEFAEKLGGGGSSTAAAAQTKGSLKEVEKEIKKLVGEMI